MLKNFVHDCTICEFLGVFDGMDLYVHDNNRDWKVLVARYGDAPHQNKTISDRVPTSDPHFLQANDWSRNGSTEVLVPVDHDTDLENLERENDPDFVDGVESVDLPELNKFFS